MKKHRIILTLIVIQALFLNGCASVHSNILAAENQTGYVYSGVTMDVISIKCMWAMPLHAKKNEGTSLFYSVPVAAVGSLVYLIDVPFSLVADTLWLPMDLKHDSDQERWTVFTPCYKRKEKNEADPTVQ